MSLVYIYLHMAFRGLYIPVLSMLYEYSNTYVPFLRRVTDFSICSLVDYGYDPTLET